MPLTQPVPFQEAIDKLRSKIPTGKPWSYAEWAAQEPYVRDRAFFSAKIENEFFLARMQLFLLNFLEKTKIPVEGGKPGELKLESGSMSKFVDEMRGLAISEGLGKAGIPDRKVNERDITDIRSEARLRLIFGTNIATSYGFGSWTQGMTPAVLEAFPAARVVRNPGAVTKRPRHAQEEGNVRLKTDFDYWALYMNDRAIGGFQTPYGPYGFNSFIDQQDVSRSEAEKLQLVQKGKPIKGKGKRKPGLNDEIRVQVAGLNDKQRAKLKSELGDIAKVGKFVLKLKTDKERGILPSAY